MLEKLDTLIAFAVVMLGLSLIVTIFTQMVSAALGLRGSNLLWGLETLFQELAPGLEAAGIKPRDLAREILQHPLISDSSFSRLDRMWLIGPLVKRLCAWPMTGWLLDRWRFATAIRSEELVRILQAKIDGLPDGNVVKEKLAGLLVASDKEALRQLGMLNDALAAIRPPAAAPQAPPPPAPQPGGQAVAPAREPATSYAVQVDKIIQNATDTGLRSFGKLETWFNSSMDRVSQRFVLQARIWTVVFAFLLAFAGHVDSLHLLDQLASNPDSRAALVNMRDGMLGEAKAILPVAGAAPGANEVPVSAAVLKEALAALQTADPALPKLGDIPATAVTVHDVEVWLTAQPGVPPAAAGQYRKTVIGILRDHADRIDRDLSKAGIQILPSPYPGLLSFQDWHNVLGILLAAAFLSLGAPFWYNALKNLSNLRTVVATREQQQSA